MEFLELPVRFLLSDPDQIDKYKDMGIEIEPETEFGTLHTNPASIAVFNEDDEEHVHLVLNNGIGYTIYMSIDEFKKLIGYKKYETR